MNPILTASLVLAVTILVFLAIRNIMNWYNRVNERVALMKEQNRLLLKILETLKDETPVESTEVEGM